MLEANNFLPEYVWDVICCPLCQGSLEHSSVLDSEHLACQSCRTVYPVKSGIPHLFVDPEKERQLDKTQITSRQKAFYEDIAFPNYEDCDTPALLMKKAKAGIFGASIDRSVPMGARVLEVGCGTGQLSNFLGLNYKRCIGADMSLTSLEMAKSFRDRYDIQNANFIQSNIFALPFRKNSFDLVICTGVLHHTKDAYLGFQRVLDLCKPGGYVLIGLYNSYGRIITKIRQKIFGMIGLRLLSLDYYVRKGLMKGAKQRAWVLDQYKNPHETTHTVDELLAWYEKNDVTPLAGVPPLRIGESTAASAELFKPSELGNSFEHLIVQLGWISSLAAEGGLYVITGQKKFESAVDGLKKVVNY